MEEAKVDWAAQRGREEKEEEKEKILSLAHTDTQ